MAQRTGRCAVIEQFLADGMDYMFGNPGTVEQGFLDALSTYPEMKYVLTLQESVALLVGDGYARATKRPTLVQIHSSPGLGNAIGAMYQAMRGHAPLVVIGGDAGLRYVPLEAQMYADLVAMAEPVTKWSTMVLDPTSLLRTLRRAVKIAATPPMGPVYVCLPADVLDQPCVEDVCPTSVPSTRVVPDDGFVRRAAGLLAGARQPMVFVGDGVAYSGAREEVEGVAEILGAEIWGVDSGELNVSYAHPLYQGQTGHMFGSSSYPITSRGDVNLVCGTYMVPEVFPRLEGIYAPGARVIHIDLDPGQIARNHPEELGVVADPKGSLARLLEALRSTMTAEQRAAAQGRASELCAAKQLRAAEQREKDRLVREEVPLHASRFMEELAELAPKDLCVFDEALTCSPELTRYLPPTVPGQFLQTRGGSLGVGIPGAIGLGLAHPDKTVFGFTGDGGSMYTIQALWTAAHHRVGAKFVVCNNQSYMLLKLNILQYWRDQIRVEEHPFPESFSLVDPVVDFVKMAESMGVPGLRVESPGAIAPAIRQALATDGPFLIDLILTDRVAGSKLSGACKCGQ
ncbi:MAG: thiamine pyrophosphate-binding protein [Candidatus Latescibacterota bacterium]